MRSELPALLFTGNSSRRPRSGPARFQPLLFTVLFLGGGCSADDTPIQDTVHLDGNNLAPVSSPADITADNPADHSINTANTQTASRTGSDGSQTKSAKAARSYPQEAGGVARPEAEHFFNNSKSELIRSHGGGLPAGVPLQAYLNRPGLYALREHNEHLVNQPVATEPGFADGEISQPEADDHSQ